MCCGKKIEKSALAFGIFFIIFGLFLLFFWKDVQEKIVSENFKLSDTSKTYEPWIESRVPVYVQYYFFNWTNPSDLKDVKYKPQLAEVGPYKFWEKIEKVNVTWNENGTVTYRRMRKWYFDPNDSIGNLSDKITTINVIALMAANMVKKMPSLGRLAMGMMIASTQKISVTKTVSEFLFEGYVDPLLTAGQGWPAPSKVPYDKFGWFYKRNGSSTFDGVYNVQTGENGMDRFGSVSLWNFNNQTRFYKGNCGQVKGSGGDYWPWKRKKDTDIYLFSSDLCRYIQYKYSQEVRISEIDGFKFVADSSLFDNGTTDSNSKCFCNGQCLPSGVLNISVCKYDAPVFTSYPHFYQADPVYLNAFDGMRPDKDLHENYVALEPTYGIPLEIAARIQINVFVKPNRYVALLDGVQQLIFPVFWLDQRVSVPAERLMEVKILLYLPGIIFALSFILLIAGVIFLLIFSYCKVKKNYQMGNINKCRSQKSLKNTKYFSPNSKRIDQDKKRRTVYADITSLKLLETDF